MHSAFNSGTLTRQMGLLGVVVNGGGSTWVAESAALAAGFLRWKSTTSSVPKRSSFPGEVVESMKLQDGKKMYACVTVTLQPPGHLGVHKGISAVVTSAWELLRSCFKGQSPNVVLMYTSLGKPLAQAAAKQLSKVVNRGLAAPVAIAGCSATRWQPEGERASVDPDKDAHRAHHFSLAAAHLPDSTPYTFFAQTDSLPSLPMLDEALTTRPPQFLLFTHPTNQYATNQANQLMKRFMNIFPDSNVFGVVADYIDAKERPMFVQNGIAVPAQVYPSDGQQITTQGRKRKGPSRSQASQPLVEECPGSSSSPGECRPAAGLDAVFQDADDAPGSILFVSDDYGYVHVHERGSVGIALYPHAARHRLQPQSALNLVKVMASGFRFEASNKLLLMDRVQQLLNPLHASTSNRAPTDSRLRQKQPTTSSTDMDVPQPSSGAVSPATMVASSSKGLVPAHVSPKGLHGQSGRKQRPPSQQASEVPMFVLSDVSLFPDEAMELRVFEPRYQLLVRQCIEQGALFGIAHSGLGTFAKVTSCRALDNGPCVVEIKGGSRFTFTPNSARVLPASFGLTVAQVEELQDEVPGPEYEGPTCDLAVQALQLIVQEWLSQVRKRAVSGSAASVLADAGEASLGLQRHASLVGASGQRTAVMVADRIVDARPQVVEAMDIVQAQTVSLWLGGLLSNTMVPSFMKREWLSSQNSYVRLGQQVQLLNQHHQLRREVVLRLMRQPSHPLHSMLEKS